MFFSSDDEEALAREWARRLPRAPDLLSTTSDEGRFWSAEDYHQKYRLRRKTDVVTELRRRFGDRWDEHTLATKLNAAGHGFDLKPWLSTLPEPVSRSFHRS